MALMEPFFSAVIGGLVGGFISYLLNLQKFDHQMRLLREQYKTEYMAEETVKHFLEHEDYMDRSFDVIKRHVGGFDDDELRKILVRAGAIRVFKEETELWRLLSRMDESIGERKNY